MAARKVLAKANDDLTTTVARALLVPLAARSSGPPSPYEVDAFWQLASGRGRPVNPVNVRFEEATRTRLPCEQFEARAELALHAAVGLDPDVQDRVDKLFRGRLTAPGIPLDQRKRLALACSHLESLSADSAAAAEVLADTMRGVKDSEALRGLARGPDAVAGRLEPDAARAARAQATRTPTDVMQRAGNPADLARLADGLRTVGGRLDPSTAAGAVRTLVDATNEPNRYRRLDPIEGASGLVVLTALMQPVPAVKVCEEAAGVLAAAFARTADPAAGARLLEKLFALGHKRGWHADVLGTGVFGGPSGPFLGVPLLHPTLSPQPRPPPQMLVDLLKHPFCAGETRQAVLGALGHTYNRRFADPWEFVRFVRDNNVPLDLLSPPKRPDPQP